MFLESPYGHQELNAALLKELCLRLLGPKRCHAMLLKAPHDLVEVLYTKKFGCAAPKRGLLQSSLALAGAGDSTLTAVEYGLGLSNQGALVIQLANKLWFAFSSEEQGLFGSGVSLLHSDWFE